MNLGNNAGIDVLIVGAGAYVCGKGSDGFGTILPAVFEAWRQGVVKTIYIAAATKKGAEQAKAKAAALKKLFQLEPEIVVTPQDDDDPLAYQKVFDQASPQAAIISVPDHLHFEISKKLIQKGVHVQVVKPLVPTVAETRQLVDLKNKHGVYGCVEYHKRFDEANLKLLGLIRQGALGRLLHFSINYSQKKVIPTEIFRAWVDRTNIFQYLGVHYVDLVHFLTGAHPLRVMSVGTKKYLVEKGVDTWDTMHTMIEWKLPNGDETFFSSHLTGWIDPNTSSAMSDQRLEVIGTAGRYRSDQKDRGVEFVNDAACTEKINPYFSQIYPSLDGLGQHIAGYGPKSIIQFLCDCTDIVKRKVKVEELQGLRATFESSFPVAQVLEASHASLINNQVWVPVSTYD